jgi:hypothetical protein
MKYKKHCAFFSKIFFKFLINSKDSELDPEPVQIRLREEAI